MANRAVVFYKAVHKIPGMPSRSDGRGFRTAGGKIVSVNEVIPATTDQVMKLRTLVGQAALRVGELALECAGGSGFYRAKGLEQRFRDLQGARYHPLRTREQQLYSGRCALGLSVDG